MCITDVTEHMWLLQLRLVIFFVVGLDGHRDCCNCGRRWPFTSWWRYQECRGSRWQRHHRLYGYIAVTGCHSSVTTAQATCISSRLLLMRRYRADLGWRRHRRLNVLGVSLIGLGSSSILRFHSCVVTTGGGCSDVFCKQATWCRERCECDNRSSVEMITHRIISDAEQWECDNILCA